MRYLEVALKATTNKHAKTRGKTKNVVKELNTVSNNFESVQEKLMSV